MSRIKNEHNTQPAVVAPLTHSSIIIHNFLVRCGLASLFCRCHGGHGLLPPQTSFATIITPHKEKGEKKRKKRKVVVILAPTESFIVVVSQSKSQNFHDEFLGSFCRCLHASCQLAFHLATRIQEELCNRHAFASLSIGSISFVLWWR